MDSLSPLALRKMDRVAASRQKSCNACVRGKRKCDKKTPRCTRCAAKGLDCIYQKLPPGAAFHDEDLGASPAAVTTTTASSSSAASDLLDFDMGFDIDSLGTSMDTTPTTATTSPESLHTTNVSSIDFDANLNFSIINQLMANNSSAGAELWNIHDFGPSKMELPPVPTRAPTAIRDLSLLGDGASAECMSFNPLDVHDPQTRIGFIIDMVMNMYRPFSRTRTLPFIHHRLYGSNLPRTMVATFSAATAYATRTPENKAWVYKLVTDVAKDIHREGERADTPIERVARVQALVILDSIRLFDGDVALRATMEREMPQFLNWANDLKNLKNDLEEGQDPALLMSRDRPPASWESWILLETVRRTSMMALCFVCLSHMLKSVEPPAEAMETPHYFTASRHLWEATSSVNFYQAWHLKPQFCVPDMDFKEVWLHARPDDIDEFTKMMLTAQAGPEAMDYFMHGSGNPAITA
ncbi:hypothetical protein BGZ63DRAFT_5801 [Mariannaea sp. PMI_226]|nr:hypothetical protein BGZ63DRAFT_5801 [Mariannaea sp. PMI_226]